MCGAVDISFKSRIFYHGSNVEVINPKIIKGRFTKDFRYGFYCTIKEEQAKRWSLKNGYGVVSKYEYNSLLWNM